LQVTEEEEQHLGQKIVLRVRPARMSFTKIRCYLYSDISCHDVSEALKKWHYVLENFDPMENN
jgi:hypothetical protein